MESFWDILKRLMESVKSVEAEEMIEVDFDSSVETSHHYATFHTNEQGKLVLTMFDADQWSLVEDMATFMNKTTENIVRELDPNSPNVYIISDDEIELGPTSEDDF